MAWGNCINRHRVHYSGRRGCGVDGTICPKCGTDKVVGGGDVYRKVKVELLTDMPESYRRAGMRLFLGERIDGHLFLGYDYYHITNVRKDEESSRVWLTVEREHEPVAISLADWQKFEAKKRE